MRVDPCAPQSLLKRAVSGANTQAQGLFARLFPSDSLLCGARLESDSRPQAWRTCLLKMHPISARTCSVCGERLPRAERRRELQTRAPSQQSCPSFAKARAYGTYQSELRDLIRLLNYEGVLPAARILGRMLAEAIDKLDLAQEPTLVVPLPLDASSRRQRGFNPAKMIARVALNNLGSASLRLAPVLVHERTVSQIALTRTQRLENTGGAFRVVHPNRTEARAILLVDDILTRTMASQCVRVLQKACAKNVWVATVARRLKASDALPYVEPQCEDAAQAS